MEQFFIKIAPNLDLVSCGNLEVLKNKTRSHYHIKDNKTEYFSANYSLDWLNSKINNLNTKKDKVLFYIHGFWASFSIPFHRTTSVFHNNYFRTEQDDIAAIIHVIWNANTLYYGQSIYNLKNSKDLLTEILIGSQKVFNKKLSIMCHSMGNRFLFETLKSKELKSNFEELLMVAPDLHITHFEENYTLFSSIAKKVFVLFHKKDKTLRLSQFINKVERLGRRKLEVKNSNISFIDLTYLNDINSLADKVMRHNYFIYSDTVRKEIERLLKE